MVKVPYLPDVLPSYPCVERVLLSMQSQVALLSDCALRRPSNGVCRWLRLVVDPHHGRVSVWSIVIELRSLRVQVLSTDLLQ